VNPQISPQSLSSTPKPIDPEQGRREEKKNTRSRGVRGGEPHIQIYQTYRSFSVVVLLELVPLAVCS
jgi:hypothetical protein